MKKIYIVHLQAYKCMLNLPRVVPVNSAVKSYLTAWCDHNLSNRSLIWNRLTSTTEQGSFAITTRPSMKADTIFSWKYYDLDTRTLWSSSSECLIQRPSFWSVKRGYILKSVRRRPEVSCIHASLDLTCIRCKCLCNNVTPFYRAPSYILHVCSFWYISATAYNK